MFDDDAQTNQTNDNNDNGGSVTPTMGLGSSPTTSPADAQPFVAPANDVTETPQENSSTVKPAADLGDLNKIKTDALAQLSPLVHKLDQSPEDKYKTLMMMIQASDNQALLSEAYECAQDIKDEKVKAEALLNIVNEINYFTQKG